MLPINQNLIQLKWYFSLLRRHLNKKIVKTKEEIIKEINFFILNTKKETLKNIFIHSTKELKRYLDINTK